jgi:hypothetical protein
MIPSTQLGADAIEVANTDVNAELVLQYRLHLTTWHLGSRLAGRKQPLEHSFLQFDWMPMSPSFAMRPRLLNDFSTGYFSCAGDGKNRCQPNKSSSGYQREITSEKIRYARELFLRYSPEEARAEE